MRAWPAILAAALILGGCGGSGSSGGGGSRSVPGEFPDGVARVESTFVPSEFGIEGWSGDTAAGLPPSSPDSAATPAAASPDTVSGFRVQVSISEDIDQAVALRDSLSAALPDAWVYVVHHPPYYKVRVGDFGERHVAAAFLDELKQRGYPDAWIVPDRVLRNPPPKPVPLPPDSAAQADSAR